MSIKSLYSWLSCEFTTGKPEAAYLRRIIKLEHPEFNNQQISEEITSRQHAAEKRELQVLRETLKGEEIKIDDLIDSKALTEAEDELKDELFRRIN